MKTPINRPYVVPELYQRLHIGPGDAAEAAVHASQRNAPEAVPLYETAFLDGVEVVDIDVAGFVDCAGNDGVFHLVNDATRFFRDLTTQRLRRGVFRSLSELIEAITAFIGSYNARPTPFVWTAKASDILAKVKRARKKLNTPR